MHNVQIEHKKVAVRYHLQHNLLAGPTAIDDELHVYHDQNNDIRFMPAMFVLYPVFI
jgi:hypothetical protein